MRKYDGDMLESVECDYVWRCLFDTLQSSAHDGSRPFHAAPELELLTACPCPAIQVSLGNVYSQATGMPCLIAIPQQKAAGDDDILGRCLILVHMEFVMINFSFEF